MTTNAPSQRYFYFADVVPTLVEPRSIVVRAADLTTARKLAIGKLGEHLRRSVWIDTLAQPIPEEDLTVAYINHVMGETTWLDVTDYPQYIELFGFRPDGVRPDGDKPAERNYFYTTMQMVDVPDVDVDADMFDPDLHVHTLEEAYPYEPLTPSETLYAFVDWMSQIYHPAALWKDGTSAVYMQAKIFQFSEHQSLLSVRPDIYPDNLRGMSNLNQVPTKNYGHPRILSMEALVAFVGWIMSSNKRILVGRDYDPAYIETLIEQFLRVQGLDYPRARYPSNVRPAPHTTKMSGYAEHADLFSRKSPDQRWKDGEYVGDQR